jgi:3-phosphoshikimate 1-carboxyvinyltransferase
MRLVIKRSHLSGRVEIPASKSHTIRAVFVGCLADGTSELIKPLDSLDTRAAIRCAEAFGAEVTTGENWKIRGVGGHPRVPENVVDAANSGTSIMFFTGLASTLDGYTVLTGDAQVRRRPIQPLLDGLNNLGADAFSTRDTGTPPVVVRGKLKGGQTDVEGRTSHYTSALLFNCPRAEGDSELRIENPKEKPYIEMTLGWLDKQGVKYERDGFSSYSIPGGQQYVPFRERIPGDFSTATFFLCGASITDSDVMLLGLDMKDTQGDKKVVSFLQEMGADITVKEEGLVIRGGDLKGIELDLGDTPDALPALAVTGCFARGETKLKNVLSARWKETDRIKVMCQELSKLGARVEELSDGMIVRESHLRGGVVNGHGDHRVVMALSLAGLGSAEGVQVETAEALRVTVPNFVDLMKELGTSITVTES